MRTKVSFEVTDVYPFHVVIVTDMTIMVILQMLRYWPAAHTYFLPGTIGLPAALRHIREPHLSQLFALEFV